MMASREPRMESEALAPTLQGLRQAQRRVSEGQTRCGGPREEGWRIGPKPRRVCVMAAGNGGRSNVAPPANTGRAGNGEGPPLCA